MTGTLERISRSQASMVAEMLGSSHYARPLPSEWQQQLGPTLTAKLEDPDQRFDWLDLIALLREHGRGFFTPDSLESYKEEKRRSELAKMRREGRRVWLRCDRAVVACWVVLLATYFLGAPTGGAVAGTGVVLALVILQQMIAAQVYAMAIWTPYDLDSFREKEPLPTEVEALIARLQPASGRLEFRVFKLVGTPDPLLMVRIGSAELCTEAWDEPGLGAPLL
jgi:hypothetical protein